MLKKLYNIAYKLGEFAKPLVTSLFFLSILILIIYFSVFNEINLYVTLINNFAVSYENKTQVKAEYDHLSKSLLKIPSYGDVFGKISLPDIDREIALYHGDSLDILRYGAGHYAFSYFPGEGGSIIIMAHNSYEHFMYLPELKNGSKVTINTDYGKFTYEMYDSKIISDKDYDALPVQDKEEILMLYTCWPIGTYEYKDHRYVSYFKLVGAEYV